MQPVNDAQPRTEPDAPQRRGGRKRSAARALALVGSGLVLFGCGGGSSDPQPTETVASVSVKKIAKDLPKVPTDRPQYVYVKGKQAQDALAAAKPEPKPKPKPAPGPTPSKEQLKPGPTGLPPASVGNNGSYTPSERHRDLSAASMAGVGGQPPERSAILVGRTALAPPSAPPEVDRAIAAANAIVGTPYIWGGGHGSWNDRGYDCSGAVSYALGGGGLLDAPLASTGLESWGEPGPGRWITVYANAGHAYAVIAGLRWDTVGDLRGTGPRWHAELPYPKGFTVRHPPGL